MEGERFNQPLREPPCHKAACIGGKGKQREHEDARENARDCQQPVGIDG